MAPFKAYYIQECEQFLRNNPGRAITQYQISGLLGKAFLRAAVPTTAINGFRKCGIFPFNPDVFCDADYLAAKVSDIPISNNDEGPNVAETSGGNEAEKGAADDSSNGDLAIPGPSGLVQRAFAVSPKEIIPLPKQTMMKQRKKSRKKGKAAIITSSPYKNELLDEMKNRQEKRKKKVDLKNLVRPTLKKRKQQTEKCVHPKKRPNIEDEEEQEQNELEEDCSCFYCNEVFSKSRDNKGWIQCSSCKVWAHEECAGCEEDDADFSCEYCKYAL